MLEHPLNSIESVRARLNNALYKLALERAANVDLLAQIREMKGRDLENGETDSV